ncbi:MAG TPA: hypothetical protein VJB87_01170 [Candidatus Nanoarchaeia archaeon]|nr:hypothetical protein [Candidatus Nanoarchaeia archaeon]
MGESVERSVELEVSSIDEDECSYACFVVEEFDDRRVDEDDAADAENESLDVGVFPVFPAVDLCLFCFCADSMVVVIYGFFFSEVFYAFEVGEDVCNVSFFSVFCYGFFECCGFS